MLFLKKILFLHPQQKGNFFCFKVFVRGSRALSVWKILYPCSLLASPSEKYKKGKVWNFNLWPEWKWKWIRNKNSSIENGNFSVRWIFASSFPPFFFYSQSQSHFSPSPTFYLFTHDFPSDRIWITKLPV